MVSLRFWQILVRIPPKSTYSWFFKWTEISHKDKNTNCQEQNLSYKANQKSMIPLKVQCPLPCYRIGAVSAGGTIQGIKNNLVGKGCKCRKFSIATVPGSSRMRGWTAMAPSTNSSRSATTDSRDAQASDLWFKKKVFSSKNEKSIELSRAESKDQSFEEKGWSKTGNLT